jgi:hypothetical protein
MQATPKGFHRQRAALKSAVKKSLKTKKDLAAIEATLQAIQAGTRPKFVAVAALLQMASTTKVEKLAAFVSIVTVVWSGTKTPEERRWQIERAQFEVRFLGKTDVFAVLSDKDSLLGSADVREHLYGLTNHRRVRDWLHREAGVPPADAHGTQPPDIHRQVN